MNRWPTIEDIKNSKVGSINPNLSENQATPQKRTKFGNTATDVEGEVIHSKKEAARYKSLRMALKAGRIGFLARQVQYELNEGGSHSLIYIADFQYVDKQTGKLIVEDTKGFQTKEFKKKQKLMKKIHGIILKIS